MPKPTFRQWLVIEVGELEADKIEGDSRRARYLHAYNVAMGVSEAQEIQTDTLKEKLINFYNPDQPTTQPNEGGAAGATGDFQVYLDALENLINMKYANGTLIDREGKLIKDEEDAIAHLNYIMWEASMKGYPDPTSPYYNEIMPYVQRNWWTEGAEDRAKLARQEADESLEQDIFNWKKGEADKEWKWREDQATQANKQWGITHALKMDAAELQRQRDLSVGRWDASQIHSRWIGKSGGGITPAPNESAPPYSWGQSGADLSRQTELKKAEDWDKIKEMTLGSLESSPDRNWLKTDIEKMTTNPYRPDPGLAGETGLAQMKASEKQYESALASIDKRTKDETDYTTRGDPNIEWQKGFYRDRLNQVRDQIGTFQLQLMGGVEGLEDVGGTPSDVYGMAKSYGYKVIDQGGAAPDFWGNLDPAAQASLETASRGLGYGSLPMSPAEPTGVKVPKWAPQYIPGLTGKYIPGTGGIKGKAPKIMPFSPQQWRATSTATRQKLAGYADFSGQDIGDMTRRMWQRQPQDLRLGKNWRPARQF